MENNRKDQQFNQTPSKTATPERKDGMSSPARTTNKPEIDLPLKGGRSEADLSSTQPRKDGAAIDTDRSDRSAR